MKKKIIFLAIMFLATIGANATKIPVSTDVKGDGGCNYHIEGYVDVDIWGMSVNCYDVDVTSDCGFSDSFNNCP